MYLYADKKLVPPDKTRDALRAIIAKSPHAAAKASALYSLAINLMMTPAAAPETLDEARKLFETLKKDHPDSSYATSADAYVFELTYLQIGKSPPDFETTDENGKAWKLSDYRGKVTVVDFWGFW